MSAFFSFLLLGVMSQTFSQTLLQTRARLNILQPNRAPDLSNTSISSPSTNNAGSQPEETDSNLLQTRARLNILQPNRAPDFSNSPISSPSTNNAGSQPEETDLNPPNLLQTRARLNILQPNRAPGLSDSPISTPSNSNAGSQLEETDLNSPILSKFAEYNLQVSEEDGVYPILFDVSFSPDEVREKFYNEAVYFALDNGLYDVGNLPQQLADAAAQAFPNLTPLELFKVTSNTLELILQKAGITTEGNYQVLARLNAKALEDAMDSVKVKDAPSALHAIIVGAGVFLRSLSVNTPDDIRFGIATYADQFSKVPTNGGFQ